MLQSWSSRSRRRSPNPSRETKPTRMLAHRWLWSFDQDHLRVDTSRGRTFTWLRCEPWTSTESERKWSDIEIRSLIHPFYFLFSDFKCLVSCSYEDPCMVCRWDLVHDLNLKKINLFYFYYINLIYKKFLNYTYETTTHSNSGIRVRFWYEHKIIQIWNLIIEIRSED